MLKLPNVIIYYIQEYLDFCNFKKCFLLNKILRNFTLQNRNHNWYKFIAKHSKLIRKYPKVYKRYQDSVDQYFCTVTEEYDRIMKHEKKVEKYEDELKDIDNKLKDIKKKFFLEKLTNLRNALIKKIDDEQGIVEVLNLSILQNKRHKKYNEIVKYYDKVKFCQKIYYGCIKIKKIIFNLLSGDSLDYEDLPEVKINSESEDFWYVYEKSIDFKGIYAKGCDKRKNNLFIIRLNVFEFNNGSIDNIKVAKNVSENEDKYLYYNTLDINKIIKCCNNIKNIKELYIILNQNTYMDDSSDTRLLDILFYRNLRCSYESSNLFIYF